MGEMSRKRKRERSGRDWDWSGVPVDILCLIASKVTSSEDHIAFAAVCQGWRSAARLSKPHLLPLTPWSIPVSYITNTATRAFYNFTRSRQSQIYLPEIKGCNIYGSPFGWLITCCVRMNINKATISLFNPLSRSIIPLPDPIKPFCFNHYSQFCVFKALLTAPPGDPNCFVVINYEAGKLACTRPVFDSAWHRLNAQLLRGFHVLDFIYFLGKLYALTHGGWLRVLDLGAEYKRRAPSPELEGSTPPPPFRPFDRERYHLVEFGGELIMVVKYADYLIEVFKIDVHTKEWTRVESLGNSCLLLQDDISFISVDADDTNRLVPGCIYYPNTGTGDTKLVPGCIYYPDTSRCDTHIVPHHKLLIPRCIYYPSAQIWTVKQVNLLPNDVYSSLYPSITFTPSMPSYLVSK